MSYTQNVDGYGLETTWGTSVIDGVGDSSYLWGIQPREMRFPSPKYEYIRLPAAVGYREPADGGLITTICRCHGTVGFIAQNGVFLYYAMGYRSTAGAGPYTHTITPTTAGAALPSFTWHHEEKGSATNEQYQAQGCKVDSMTLMQDMTKDNILFVKMEIKAKTVSDPAIELTNAPALPATATTGPYPQPSVNWDTAGTNTSVAGIQNIELAVINAITEHHADSYTAGVYDGQWPYLFTEKQLKDYKILLDFHPNTIEREMWDDSKSRGVATKTLVIKWTKSTNDYIQLTASDCAVILHTKESEPSGQLKVDQAEIIPRALSWEVKDSIPGGTVW